MVPRIDVSRSRLTRCHFAHRSREPSFSLRIGSLQRRALWLHPALQLRAFVATRPGLLARLGSACLVVPIPPHFLLVLSWYRSGRQPAPRNAGASSIVLLPGAHAPV